MANPTHPPQHDMAGETADVTVRVTVVVESGTTQGEIFKNSFIADLSKILGVPQDRFVILSLSPDAHGTLVHFVILADR
jgi:hypothetical protein